MRSVRAFAYMALAVLAVGCQAATVPTSALGGATTRPGTQAPASEAVAPTTDLESGLPFVDLDSLPPEAAETVALIGSDGPFPYDQDGAIFQNREGILPDQPASYYHEYTVETPGLPDRGARRIVTGAAGQLYWTDNHYDSFHRIRE